MRLDQAQELKAGDSVYNCFLDKLTISHVYHDDAKHLIFSTVDSQLVPSAYYYQDLYLTDLTLLAQSELDFLDWTKTNKDLVKSNIEHYQLIKNVFVQGFDKGYELRLKSNAEEQLQK